MSSRDLLRITLLALLASAACRPASPPPAPPTRAAQPSAGPATRDARDERAREALGVLKRELMAALTSALAEGPEAALTACRDEAPRITAAASAGGVRVGRSSHRLRNPANAPAPWLEPLLQRYLDGEDSPWLTTELPEGALGLVEPIRMQPICATCHGTEIAEPVSDRLAALYPEDSATGFREGELRGVFWAVVQEGP